MMDAHFYLGLQIGCMGPLALLMVEAALHESTTRQDAALLVGGILAFTSTALHTAAWCYTLTGNLSQMSALRLCARALAPLSAALYGYAVARRTPPDAGWAWGALVGTLLPSWLSGIWAIAAHEPSAITFGLTMSAGIAHVILLRRSAVRRRHRALTLNDRSATLLHEQMRPHFLFNSIAALCSLCKSDPTLVESGLEDLAGYLRGNIESLSNTRIVSFEQELEHIECYLALEQLNPASSFEVAYDLRIIDFELPVLSVEPLVENAIVHGVRQMGEGGLVIVTTESQGDLVRVTVEDNGPGMPDGTTAQQSTRASRGIENVRERLDVLCGGSLTIQSNGQGTRAVMLIPQGKGSPWSR